jgi:UDP-glucose:(heptosyl)LPS alpha-1,3-glucosyltransferase
VEKKIRFAIGIQNLSRRKGGAEKYLVDLCSRMADEGHDVHVYAERCQEEDPRIHFHRVKTLPFPRSLRLLSFAMRASKAIREGKYDITFGVGNTLEADVLQPHGGVHWAWFWRSLRAYDHPLVWLIKFLGRVLSPKQWVSGWIENAPYRKRNHPEIVAISDMVKRDMIRCYGIPEDRVTVVYNGVDLDHFHPKNRRYREEIRTKHGIVEEFVILFVSNNFRMKGLVFLIKALARLKKRCPAPFRLLILGRDRQEPYRRLASRIGLSEETIFAGSTDNPEKYYGAADLLVHPSFYDACSLTVLEALASGLPVITTSTNGASGVLHQGEEGYVLSDPRDEQDLEEKIAWLLASDRRAQASRAARVLAEHYSEEKNWKEMRAIFEKTIVEREATA